MKKILAKLKNDQNVIIFEDADIDGLKDVYKIPLVTGAIPFEVNSKTFVEGQWYFMALTEEQKEEMLGGYATEDSTAAIGMMSPDSYSEVRVIYMVSGEGTLFTKISSKHIVNSKKYVTFGEKPRLSELGNSIVLTGEVDAYWNGQFLYFKKFAAIQSLFPGIQKIYKEATEEVTNTFLSSPLFELKDEMSSEFIGLRNRRRISSIIEGKVVDLNDPEMHEKYIAYAQEYDLDLEIDEGKISLIDNADISKVIDLIGESFYTAEITGEKREIRTSRKLVHGKRKRAR